MSRTVVDEAQVDATSRKLTQAVDGTLVPQLQSLQNDVNSLLGDGLVLAQTSPALQESYAEFNKSVTSAVENIKQFAAQFNSVKDAVKNLDDSISKGIKHP